MFFFFLTDDGEIQFSFDLIAILLQFQQIHEVQ